MNVHQNIQVRKLTCQRVLYRKIHNSSVLVTLRLGYRHKEGQTQMDAGQMVRQGQNFMSPLALNVVGQKTTHISVNIRAKIYIVSCIDG